MSRVDEWERVAIVAKHVYGRSPTGLAVSSFRVAETLSRLAKVARTLHRLYEFQCNEPIEVCDACGSVAGRKHVPSQCFYAKLEAWEKRAEAIGAELGVLVTTQRDPRGAAVKMWADHEGGRMLGCF